MEFITKYGYLAVFLGSLVEGESVILTAGVLAHQGYLSLYGIIIVSFLGTLFADQSLYFVGRHYGERILQRWPSLRPRADRAFKLLHRYDTLFILSFRFVYGIRTISPVIIGMANVGVKRYAILNFIAAAIWAVLSCTAGYLLGEGAVSLWKSFLQHLSLSWLLGIGGGLAVISAAFILWRRSKAPQTSETGTHDMHKH